MHDAKKVYIKKKMKQYYIFSIVFFVCFIALNVAIPNIYINYISKHEQAIPKDLGVIRYDYYEDAIENATVDVAFDQVHIESRWTYYSKEFEKETLYDIKVTPNEVSDLGVFPKGWYNNLIVDPLEYLYGEPYESSNEVVITDYISLRLFNRLDSVGETLDISDQTFLVTGVIKENEDVRYDLFISDETEIDKTDMYLLDDEHTYVYIIDDELISKLYALGGFDLADNTMTMRNQMNLNIDRRTIINSMNFVLIAIYIYMRFKTIHHARLVSGQGTPFKSFIRACQNVTWAILIFFILAISAIAMKLSYKVSINTIFTNILSFYPLLYLYTVPIIIYVISKISDIIHNVNKNKRVNI